MRFLHMLAPGQWLARLHLDGSVQHLTQETRWNKPRDSAVIPPIRRARAVFSIFLAPPRTRENVEWPYASRVGDGGGSKVDSPRVSGRLYEHLIPYILLSTGRARGNSPFSHEIYESPRKLADPAVSASQESKAGPHFACCSPDDRPPGRHLSTRGLQDENQMRPCEPLAHLGFHLEPPATGFYPYLTSSRTQFFPISATQASGF
jgi:hypothetical protein